MKKSFIHLFTVAILFFCTACVFEPSPDISNIAKKYTYKSFSELKDPMIFSLPIYQDFKFWGNEKFGQVKELVGDAIVIYDVENNKVFDYVVACSNSDSFDTVYTVKKSDSTCSYFFYMPYLNKFVELNPAGTELKNYNIGHKKQRSTINLISPYYSNDKLYLTELMDNSYDEDYIITYKSLLRTFNTNNGEWNVVKAENDSETITSSDFHLTSVQDENGTIWVQVKKKLPDEVTIVYKVGNDNAFTETGIYLESYKNEEMDENGKYPGVYSYALFFAQNGKLIFNKDYYGSDSSKKSSMLIIDVQTNEQIEIPFSDNVEYNFFAPNRIFTVNEKNYLFVRNRFNLQFSIYELDINTGTTTLLDMDIDSSLRFDTAIVRGNSIYVIGRNLDNNNLYCIDFDTNQLSKVHTFTIDDLQN